MGTAFTSQDLAADLPTAFISLQAWHLNPITGWPTLLRPPIASHPKVHDPTWYGNINPLSIAYAFRPRLRPD